MLQMTCAAIGRDSPKRSSSDGPSGKKRKIENNETISATSAEVSKTVLQKSPVQAVKDSPRSMTSEQSAKINEDIKATREISARSNTFSNHKPVLKSSPQRANFVRANSASPQGHMIKLNASNNPSPRMAHSDVGSKVSAQAAAAALAAATQSQNAALSSLMPTATSLLQSAEIDRYLRASASLYGSTLGHPALSCYPSMGLLPSMGYMGAYLPAAQWNAQSLAAASLPGLAAYSSHLQIPQMGVANTGSDSDTSNHSCNWGSCGKSFGSSDLLAAHVKTDHLGQPSTATPQSHVQAQSVKATTVGPAQSALQSSVPRFSPYHVPSYPRDLLTSRFVYS